MACTSPLYRVPVSTGNFALLYPQDQKRLKNHGVFLKYDVLQAYKDLPGWKIDQVQVLRCGQCTDCRLAYSRDWAIRCSLEASLHKHNYFVTLTYDDLHLPKKECIDYKGVVYESYLVRRHVQLFMKNLREWERTHNNNTNVKVFYCGEYGGLTNRPHYHLCLFGVSEIPDLRFGFKKGSYTFYKSELYESFWAEKLFKRIKDPRGFVDISEVSFDSIAYTARYCMKKQQGVMKKSFLELYDTLIDPPPIRPQPFIGMSLKPGIASEYYEKNKFQIYSEDLVKYQKKFDLFKSRPPRYFDRLFDSEYPGEFGKIKARRLSSGIGNRKYRTQLFSESELHRLEREEQILKDKEVRRGLRSL